MIAEDKIADVIDIAVAAGKLIMKYYQSSYEIINKSDGTQATTADIAADAMIVSELRALCNEIEIISEESYSGQKIEGEKYWLIDPLDGTRNFIRGNKNFVVSIGLINQGNPTFGVIYHPINDEVYYGFGNTAYCRRAKEKWRNISSLYRADEGCVVVTNRAADEPDIAAFLSQQSNVTEHFVVSSAIKYCLIASGRANIYPCFSRTMTWDTAGGHAIVKAAGGECYLLDGLTPLTYSASQIENPFFIANGNRVII